MALALRRARCAAALTVASLGLPMTGSVTFTLPRRFPFRTTARGLCMSGSGRLPFFDFSEGLGERAASKFLGPELEVVLVPCLSDNYAPLIHDKSSGETAVVDTPEVGPILSVLEKRGWKLTHILNTHHHADHTGGNEELKRRTGCRVFGPAAEQIPAIDVPLKEADAVQIGSLRAYVIEVGGHTSGHIAYHFPHQRVAFVGDTLFVLGCGRLFEGTAAQMWKSLSKLRALPDDTIVYCAHEYTESNVRFALSLGTSNPDLASRVKQISKLRAAGLPTVPTLLGHEKATNPFLRADCSEIRDAMNLSEGTAAAVVFGEVRKRKDSFRG